MRAIWKGHIRFSLVTIPIQIFSAINTTESISFNQLHKTDNGRIGYEKKCKKCGKTVSMDEIVKGFEYAADQYVIIDAEDISKIKLKSTKVIEIEGFVNSAEIHPMMYETPYFIGPDGDVASKAYALLRSTLAETGKMGIGKVVIRDREDIVMISPFEEGMVMYKLRYPQELRDIHEVQLTEGVEADKQQLKLAHTLVDSMSTSMKDIELKDRYKDAVRELVQAKIEGKEIVVSKEEVQPVTDIMSALKQSLELAKKERLPMEKAKGQKKKVETEKKLESAKKLRKQKQA